jgi:hypothetical protein
MAGGCDSLAGVVAAPIDLSGREPCVDLGKRNGAAEIAKCSKIRDLRCRLDETGPRGAGRRPADANPPHAQRPSSATLAKSLPTRTFTGFGATAPTTDAISLVARIYGA